MAAVIYSETLEEYQFKRQMNSKTCCKVETEIQVFLTANDSTEPALW